MSMPFYVPPEQLTKDRAEFARKGIARGRPIVVIAYTDGVLLMGENPSGSLHKTSEIYDKVAFAGVGRFNEFEMLRVAGIRYADLKGYSYERADVTAKGLANAYAQTLGQIFTHEMKPYEIEVMIAEVGDDSAATKIYRIQFDGTLRDVKGFGAMGAMEEALNERLSEGIDGLPDLAGVVRLAADTIEAILETTFADEDWEAAVLDRNLGRRKFRRLTETEIGEFRS
ncbi:MAG: proteasome subunit alpha [Acidimicrobiia bacterium]|nr:proteasome subunit alpha [Acidimicrobiia bacterium]MDX2466291.1 proteasome subunit alpha [Acidimicrobiia bacterium]